MWVVSPTVKNDDKWDVVKSTKGILVENKKKQKALDIDGPPITKKTPTVVFPTKEAEEKHREDNKFDGKIPETMFYTYMDEIRDDLTKQKDEMETIRSKLEAEDKGDQAKFYSDRILVILDDQAGLYRGGVNGNWEINFVIKHRHYNTSLIIVTQAYKAIPKSIRTNCNSLAVFEIPNKQELKVIYEEWPENMDEDEWLAAYRHATSKPFGFLYLNNHFPRGKRAFCNFEKRITLAEEQQVGTKRKFEDEEEIK